MDYKNPEIEIGQSYLLKFYDLTKVEIKKLSDTSYDIIYVHTSPEKHETVSSDSLSSKIDSLIAQRGRVTSVIMLKPKKSEYKAMMETFINI